MSASRPSKTKIANSGGPLSAQYTFERDKNKKQPRLPPNVKIQRRPILHPAIANPFAGANVPKVVYVSASTPLMAAVKRTKKLLSLIEKRALQRVKLPDPKKGKGQEFARQLENATTTMKKEAVYIKASGRAVEKALRVGEWFKEKESGMKVEVKTGSTVVVDDLVEADDTEIPPQAQGHKSTIKTGTMAEKGTQNSVEETDSAENLHDVTMENAPSGGKNETALDPKPSESTSKNPADKKPRKKRKRDTNDPENMPEARTRWIKTIEVAISYAA